MRFAPRSGGDLHSGMTSIEGSLAPFAARDAGAIRELIRAGTEHCDARFRGVYVHVPFCFHKCHYCDFYSFVETNGREGAFVDRLLEEARAWADAAGPLQHRGATHEPSHGAQHLECEPARDGALETLFVGGGTPTLLPPALLARLLHGLRGVFAWRPGAEWTVEANPETVTNEVAQVLADAGVDRVSLGCQSFDPALLKALERWHDPASVPRAVERLRAVGITNLNLDLIFAIPGESMEQWGRDLDLALALEPTHLSCYGLVYEPNTALTMRRDLGHVTQAEQELEAAMYDVLRARLASAGFEHYEISNWARPGMRCRHNELYWCDADWLALGPSASGHADSLRWKNIARLGDWLEHRPFSPLAHAERVTTRQRSGERFMLGLRRLEGIPLPEVDALLGDPLASDGPTRRRAIEQACKDGMLERADDHLRFTCAGLLLADSVLAALI